MIAFGSRSELNPVLVASMYPGLLGGTAAAPHDPTLWELGRFATSVRKSDEGRVQSLSQPALDLLEAIMTYSRQHGVRQLLLVTSVAIERLVLRAGYPIHRLGAPTQIEGGLEVSCTIDVEPEASTDGRVGTAALRVRTSTEIQ